MTNDTYKKLGLAAVILLAPGRFILGAGLAANHYRRKMAERRGEETDVREEPAARE